MIGDVIYRTHRGGFSLTHSTPPNTKTPRVVSIFSSALRIEAKVFDLTGEIAHEENLRRLVSDA
jgi:hypothetical protein